MSDRVGRIVQLSDGQPMPGFAIDNIPEGVAILGSRQMRVSLSREDDNRLKFLCKIAGISPGEFLDRVVAREIGREFNHYMVSKLVYVLTIMVGWR